MNEHVGVRTAGAQPVLIDPTKREAAVRAVTIPTRESLVSVNADVAVLEANDVVGFNSRDIRSRPFNLLRKLVLKEMDRNGWKSIGITSAAPDAGKSFLSANLAAALGQLHDRQVYLFDLDLRGASLADKLGVQAEKGLHEFLSGQSDDLHTIGRQVNNLDLALFPCYPSRGHSAELLAGDRFEALTAAMRTAPDDVIFVCDLPPVFANDDAMSIVQRLDAYLFVVEEGITTKAQIRDAMHLLSPARCIGTVLNRYRASAGAAYGHGGNYGRYYGE
jgi:protein-tyrosine kinase